MRLMVLGALIGAGLVIAAVGLLGHGGEVYAQRAPLPATGADAGLIALSAMTGDNAQMVTLIDPKLRAMSVYRIELASGKIKLVSVRNVNWDLQMMQLNSENPLPQEIRSLLETR
jgi:hypothetical protein